MNYDYEKLQEDGSIKSLPVDDKDGEITGKCVLNLKAYFDENPEERKRLGWIKHIRHNSDELLGFNPVTQFVVRGTKTVDEYTIEDTLHALPKSEDQLAFEEMLSVASFGEGGFVFF